MRVLIAFDKFKDAISAREACEIARNEVQRNFPGAMIEACPLTDGGEGFVDVLTDAIGGRRVSADVEGPRGATINAAIGLVRWSDVPAKARALLDLPTSVSENASIAIVEMASASGLALLAAAERDPWETSTRGTGQLLRLAREHGAAAILLGIGGSATNDLGTGALAELGLAFVNANGATVSPTPIRWSEIMSLRGRILELPPIRIACDVTNPLLGPNGATAVYGPQKGLKPGDAARLEAEVARMAAMLREHHSAPDLTTLPGAGAAGGIAFGLATCANAQLVGGADLTDTWCGLDPRLQSADLVITGEGRFDETSLRGKGPGAVATRALALGKTVHVFAGQIGENVPANGLNTHAISPAGILLAQALRDTRANLSRTIRDAFAKSA